MAARYVVGYDIGGTKLGIGLSTVEGELIGSERIPNKDTRPEDVLPEMIAVTDRLLAESDVITLHCNLTPENTGMINREAVNTQTPDE